MNLGRPEASVKFDGDYNEVGLDRLIYFPLARLHEWAWIEPVVRQNSVRL